MSANMAAVGVTDLGFDFLSEAAGDEKGSWSQFYRSVSA
jgi:hypothetical protein